ncbi:MAG TPA: DUF5667 domain-containing protein [Mycobacteriales bacterium]|nr:DUF5667 domain-containing protein [Mycobacteriales bacterium]
MSVLPTRRRADAFDRRLLGGTPSSDPALAAMATLAGRLQALPIGPAPDFRAALRQRVVAVAAVQPGPAAVPLRARTAEYLGGWRSQRRIAVVAGGVAAAVVIAGVGVSASRSLPGDPFYRLKQASEAIQLDLAHGGLAKGRLELEFARTRMHEVRQLTGVDTALATGRPGVASAADIAFGGSRSERIRSAFGAMDSETLAGSRYLTGYFQQTGERAALNALRSFAVRQHRDLESVLPQLPADARPAADAALAIVAEVSSRAGTLLEVGACTAACTPIAGPQAAPSPLPSDRLGVLPCSCANASAQPTAGPSPSASPEPTTTPTPTPSGSASPTPSPTPSPSSSLPIPLPTLPTPLPTLPLPIPTPSLPVPG